MIEIDHSFVDGLAAVLLCHKRIALMPLDILSRQRVRWQVARQQRVAPRAGPQRRAPSAPESGSDAPIDPRALK